MNKSSRSSRDFSITVTGGGSGGGKTFRVALAGE